MHKSIHPFVHEHGSTAIPFPNSIVFYSPKKYHFNYFRGFACKIITITANHSHFDVNNIHTIKFSNRGTVMRQE